MYFFRKYFIWNSKNRDTNLEQRFVLIQRNCNSQKKKMLQQNEKKSLTALSPRIFIVKKDQQEKLCTFNRILSYARDFNCSVLYEWGKFHPKKFSKKSYPQICDVKNIIQKSYPKLFYPNKCHFISHQWCYPTS